MDVICMLLELAEEGALYKKQKFTTTSLSKKMKTTQQTMSNILKRLEENNFIQRETSLRGINIIITKNGKDFLKNRKKRLDNVLEKTDKLVGKVVTGIGEGKFYIQQKKYMKQFEELLDIKPYPGTLNLIVDKVEKNKFLSYNNPLTLKGFETKERSFGPIECYPIKIGKIKAAIIIPKRTHHKERIIEVISESNLRKELNLKDNSKVTLNEK